MSRKEKGDGDSATQKCGPNRHCPHSHFILWSDLECIFAVHRRVIAMDSQTDSGNWWGFSHSSRWWQSQDYPVQSSLTRIYKKRWMRIRLRNRSVRRWDRVSLFFSWKTAWYSQEKNEGQDPGNHIEVRNQYQIADCWWQRSLHQWWWHIQETQVVYGRGSLVGERVWRRWLWHGFTLWF